MMSLGRSTMWKPQIGHAAFVTEGPIWRTREGGSEWEPIKILLEGDRNSNKMNTASTTCLWLTTQVGQAHVATWVPLDLGTNTHTLSTPERSRTPNLESTDQHRSDRWAPPVRPVPAVETGQLSLTDSTLVRPVRRTGQTGYSLKAPKAPNRPTDLQTNPNSKQPQHRTTANTPNRSPEQKPTEGCTGQTGQEHRSDRCNLGSSGWTTPAGQLPQIQTSISQIAPQTWTRHWGY
jgi:hypothetical protein